MDFLRVYLRCVAILLPPPSSPPFPPPLLEVFSHLFNFIAPEQLFYRPCLLNGQSKRANESIFNYVNSRWNKQIGWSYAHFSVRGFRLVGSRSKCLFPILTDIKLHIDSLRFVTNVKRRAMKRSKLWILSLGKKVIESVNSLLEEEALFASLRKKPFEKKF